MNNNALNQKEEINQYSRKLSPITKLSTPSRPFSQIKSVTGLGKKPWNRRFIYNKIPDYYTIKDKNVLIPKKIRTNSVKNKNLFDRNYITYQQSKIYQNKNNYLKPHNRTMSGFFSQYNRGTNKEFTRNRNIISPLVNSAFSSNNLKKNSHKNLNLNLNINYKDENFIKIKKLWNELCVYTSYRELFIIIYSQLSVDEKEQLFKKELNELVTVKSDLKTLIYYIEQRNIILKKLYQKNEKLNKSKNEEIDEILIEISNLIEKLREATIDVCYAMKKLKNDINKVNNLSKYNLDLMASKLKFDKNYLIKMKGELSFLKEGVAKFYFNLNDDRTPFLLKVSEANINMINDINKNNNDKDDFFIKIVPLNEEVKEHIFECNYYIYQELIAYQQNITAKKKMFRCVSPLNNIKFMENKENDISGNNMNNFVLNESNIFRKKNKKLFREFSDLDSALSTNKIFYYKNMKHIQKLFNHGFNVKQNQDLFTQKLLSGFIPGDLLSDALLEDEKVKDDEEEEEGEEEEDDTTRNELNDLIEEKKSETDYENTNRNNNENIKKDEKNKVINNNIKGDDFSNNKSNNKNDNNNNNKKERQSDIKKINSKSNQDINQYLNDDSNDYVNIDISKDSSNENHKINNGKIKTNEKKEDKNLIRKSISNKGEIKNEHKEDEIIHIKKDDKNQVEKKI